MDNLFEKVAYLRGLSEGLKLEKSSKEGKVLTKMLEVLEEIVDEMDDLKSGQDYLEVYLNRLDDDLTYLEEELDEDLFDYYDEDDEYDMFDDYDEVFEYYDEDEEEEGEQPDVNQNETDEFEDLPQE